MSVARILFPSVAVASLLALAPLAQDGFVNWETPHVHPLDLTPSGDHLVVVNTADARLEVFSLTGSLPVHEASIPVGLDPVSARARTDDEVWVTNHVSDTVSIVSLSGRNVTRTLATDDEPCDVVFAGTPLRAFVSCSQANTILVFDSATPNAPTRISLAGEDPRALAVSLDGSTVHAAIFESGNGTTILGGGSTMGGAYPPNVVSDAGGPYGGVNPPPNAGAAFVPPIDGSLPPPPRVGLIVRRTAMGQWMDDNGGDWTSVVSGPQAALSGRPVGWTLLDHDVANVDASTLAVTYTDGLMNMNMAVAVNPGNGLVTVVGSDAENHVRFEPNQNGNFLRVVGAGFGGGGTTVVDLNPHLSYVASTLPVSERAKTLSDPRGIAWNAAGSRGYVTGMGSDNVVVFNAAGARAGLSQTIPVGQGPTGIVADDARQRLYVVNKFEATLSVIDALLETEVARLGFFDPSPAAIKAGRKHLYDAHETSGTGLVSCGSCHVDARMDRLAWDLGDPTGGMKSTAGQNLNAGLPGSGAFPAWHPMKGPMLTQTLQDIIGKEPHHWRGDRDGIEEFNGAFQGLLGDDEPRTPAEMQDFEDFLATIHFPPNPFRDFDNGLPTDLPLPGHYTTGRFGPEGQPLPNGNAQAGLALYRPPSALDGGLACASCHTRSTGAGTNHRLSGFSFQPIPPGPNGERHLALVNVDGSTNVTMKVPQLRNLYERTGFNATQLTSTAGFGFLHDGSVDSIERFLSEPVFSVASDQELADLVAFMLSFSGDALGFGSTGTPLELPGPPSQDTHAAVGTQLTLDGPPSPAETLLLDDMIALANGGAVGLVAKGRVRGYPRGFMYMGAGRFQSDRSTQRPTRAQLVSLTGAGSEVTFTVVPAGTQRRAGIDRDSDGFLDQDELAAGSDPADPESTPKAREVPSAQRP